MMSFEGTHIGKDSQLITPAGRDYLQLVPSATERGPKSITELLAKLGLAGSLAVAMLLDTSCSADTVSPAPTYSQSAVPNTASTPTVETTPSVAATPSAVEIPTYKIETQAYPDSHFEAVASWSMDFASEPNGQVDSSKWNVISSPPLANGEKQTYTDSTSNVRVENGVLVLEAQNSGAATPNYTSGRIDTLGKRNFQYGKLEITAKLPNGVGSWPAIWLEPSTGVYPSTPLPSGANPSYANGEIDIAETSGVEPNIIYCIAHSAVGPTNSKYPQKYYSTLKVPDSNTAFHIYGVSWTPNQIDFTIDNKLCYSVKKSPNDTYLNWPYNQPYYLIMNLAIGGTWFTGDPKKYPPDGIDQKMFPTSMQVKSVKYFELAK